MWLKMSKRRWIAVSVTTEEAFRLSLLESCPLIAVEKPLYPEIKGHWLDFEGVADYELTEYQKLNCILMKKVRGVGSFDDENCDIFYFPFYRL